MSKIICDYCDFMTDDKLCYKGGMDKCKGELFVCKQKYDTVENNQNRKLLYGFITWHNAKPQKDRKDIIYVSEVEEFLK